MSESKKRIIDDDNYFDQLDQSDFVTLSYDDQIKLKYQHVIHSFQSNLIKTRIQPVIIASHPMHYRHKVTASATNIKTQGKLKLRLGFYIEKTHKIKPGFESIVQDKTIEKVLKDMEYIFQKHHFTAYVKGHSRGIIKHILIRKSYANKEMLVVIVTQGSLFPNVKQIIKEIREKNSFITSVVQIIQNKETPIVLYGEEKILYGKGYIIDKIGDLSFKLSAKSFYQVNPEQMMILYQHAFKLANIQTHETVMDCYSGIGTISLLAAQYAKKVTAIEMNHVAVKDAIDNAKRNQISHVTFIRDNVETFLGTYQDKVDVLILDPPRIGASRLFIEAVKKLKPNRIIYISCFPETQARDIKQLQT